MKDFLSKLKSKQNLSFDESKSVFEILMNGKASEAEIFDFLTFLSAKGEVSDEIAGGVYVLRNKAKRVNVQNCVDTCIALRTAVSKKNKFYAQAGAGIVADSKPINEYRETVNKAKALINALR